MKIVLRVSNEQRAFHIEVGVLPWIRGLSEEAPAPFFAQRAAQVPPAAAAAAAAMTWHGGARRYEQRGSTK
jgi:hypothetical protein